MAKSAARKILLLGMAVLAAAGLARTRQLRGQLAAERRRALVLRESQTALLRQWRHQRDALRPYREDAPGERTAEAERQYYQRRIQRLEERIAFLETAAATVRAAATHDNGGDIRAAYAPARTRGPWTLLERPEMREILRLDMLEALERDYAPLLAYYDFDERSEAALMALLLDRKWTDMNLTLLRERDDLDRELLAAAEAALLADRNDLYGVIFDFLGAEDYAVFEEYEITQPERARVGELRSHLERNDLELSESQEHELIIALYAVRNAVETPPIPADDPNATESGRTRVGELYRMHALTLERAADILTEAQMEVFVPLAAAHLARQAAMPRTDATPAH